jgi:hypothetical protein
METVRFCETCCHPDDGGSKHLWNVGKHLPDYTAQQTKRQPSSYSPSREPEISQSYQTTWRNNPEDSHLHTRRCENLKFHNSTTWRNNPEGSHLHTRRRENLKSHIKQ